MTTPTITVHERDPDPPESPLLYAADGEPLVERERVKVVGFQGRARNEKATQSSS